MKDNLGRTCETREEAMRTHDLTRKPELSPEVRAMVNESCMRMYGLPFNESMMDALVTRHDHPWVRPECVVYVGVGSGPLRNRVTAAGHGQMVSRDAFRIPKCRWTFDNGAFTDWIKGQPFNEDVYLKRIARIKALPLCQQPEWCVIPDIVAGGSASLAFSVAWLKRLPESFRWYLAVQDGMTFDEVDSALSGRQIAGLFVGGTTDWKNQTACQWVAFAHARKLRCHIGRVNGRKRLQWAINIGADSVDGTGWTRQSNYVTDLEKMPTKEAMLW